MVIDPVHVVAQAGEGIERCRQRVQRKTSGHLGWLGDPLYGIRCIPHTGYGPAHGPRGTHLQALLAGGARDDLSRVPAGGGRVPGSLPGRHQVDDAGGRRLPYPRGYRVTREADFSGQDPEAESLQCAVILQRDGLEQRTDRGNRWPIGASGLQCLEV